MLNVPAFLFLSAAAIAMYFAATVQYLELVFDHYFRFVSLGIAVFGLTLGLAVTAVERESGFIDRIRKSPVGSVIIAVVAQIMAGYTALHLLYGAGWSYLLLTLVLLVPYVFWAFAGSAVRTDSRLPVIDRVSLFVGVVVGLLATSWFIANSNSLSAAWLLSAALLAFSVLPLAGRRRPVESFFSFGLAAGLLWLAMTANMDAYPRWDASAGAVTKPITMALARQKELRIDSTEWLPGIRLDRISSKRSRKDGSGWQVVNGTVPVPFVDEADSHSYQWWKHRYPLVVVPIEAAQPQRMLSVGAESGPDVNIAEFAGVGEHDFLRYVNRNCTFPVALSCFNGLGAKLADTGKYDLIYLSVPHPVKSPWVGANTQDEYLLTSQMLSRYLSSLNQGAMLAITTREEVIFMKILITVWQNLLPDSSADIMDAKNHLRLFRLSRLAPYKGAYRFLLMVSPDGFSAKQLKKLDEAGSGFPVERLIYRNQVHTPPYSYFDNALLPHSLEEVQEQLTRYAAWSMQSALGLLKASSIEHPGFFRFTPNMHPFLVWLLTGVLGLSIYAILFSFPGERTSDCMAQTIKPAVSVLLVQVFVSAAATAFFVMLIVQPAITAIAAPQQGFLWMVILALSGVIGAGGGEVIRREWRVRARPVRYVLMMLALLLATYLIYSHMPGFLQQGRSGSLWAGSAALLLLVGWLAWQLHRVVMVQLLLFYPVPLTWSWVLTGLGLLGGIIVSTQSGWPRLMMYATVLYGLVLVIGSWISVSPITARQTDDGVSVGCPPGPGIPETGQDRAPTR